LQSGSRNWEWSKRVYSGGHVTKASPKGATHEIANQQLADSEASAFTVAELGEMLPDPTDESWYVAMKEGSKWLCWENQRGFYEDKGQHVWSDTEADARAKMLIYLLENGLLTGKQ
jgi:hypothetical protein